MARNPLEADFGEPGFPAPSSAPLSGFPEVRELSSAVDVATGAPVAVEEWLDSLKIKKGSSFVFWVQRRSPSGDCIDLPAFKNTVLTNDDIGRRYGPGIYRPCCEWRRPEWESGKTQQKEGPWFTVPPEYELPHQEFLLEQQAIFEQKKQTGSVAPGVHVHNSGTPTREVMEMAREMFAISRPQDAGSGNLTQLFAIVAPIAIKFLEVSMENSRREREEAREDRKLMLQVLAGRSLDPAKEVQSTDPLSALSNPQNPAIQQVRQLGQLVTEFRTAFGGGEVAAVEAPSTLDKALGFLGGMVNAIGPFLLKSAASGMVPQPVIQQAVRTQGPAEQASLALLRQEPTLQAKMEANLAAIYGPAEAAKLMKAAKGLPVELDPVAVAEGMAELRGDAPRDDADEQPGHEGRVAGGPEE